MKLHIKNMVCPRCIMAVRTILASQGFTTKEVNLGDAEIEEQLSNQQQELLAKKLEELGFELLDDPRSQLVEQIRIAVLEWVRMKGASPKMSVYLCQQLAKDYSTLSKLFSEVRGITLERYAILHRIEYAKELLCYSQLTTSQIAYALDYSSPAHLSKQFKQVVGMLPKDYREHHRHDRKPLSEL